MVKPSIDELTNGKFNRYILVIAAAKSARYITNVTGAMDSDNIDAVSENGIVSKKESLEDKSVKIAINKLYSGDILLQEETLDRALNAGLNGIEGIN
ncbi:MAG: DNA-directed RNA polymerase subunit omega [Ruminococcaceae bacterium]|nr:DNA-directed RNA polymerase subunit omega [Oscillospiraceae bacterium]